MNSDDPSDGGPAAPGRSVPDATRAAVVLVCAFVAFGIVGVVRSNRRAAIHGDATARVASMVEAISSTNCTRKPLSGDPVVGRARDHYERAFARLRSLGDHERATAYRDIEEAVHGTVAARTKAVARSRERFTAAWDELERGARRTDASPGPVVRSTGDDFEPLGLGKHHIVLEAMSLDGLALMESGDGARGARRILSAMQVAEDFTRSHSLVEQVAGFAGLSPEVLQDHAKIHGFGELDQAGLIQVFDGTERLLGRCASDGFKPSLVGDVVAMWSSNTSGSFRVDDARAGSTALAEHVRVADDYLRTQRGHDFLETHLYAVEVAETQGEETYLGKLASTHANVVASLRHHVVRLGFLRVALARELAPLEGADPRLVAIADGDGFVDPFGGRLEIESDQGVTVFRVRADVPDIAPVEYHLLEN